VAARESRPLLAERPDAIELSVLAMPRGSPGMDWPAYGLDGGAKLLPQRIDAMFRRLCTE
jgi:hypothetical protein